MARRKGGKSKSSGFQPKTETNILSPAEDSTNGDPPRTKEELQETLQREFCPPLDTSLLAALIAELDLENPDDSALLQLRVTLQHLADESEFELQENSPDLAQQQQDHEERSSEFTSSNSLTDSSISNHFTREQINSPLGFLEAALPHVPRERLLAALSTTTDDDDGSTVSEDSELDMESVVLRILSDEYIRDLQERGLEAAPASDSGFGSEEGANEWEMVVGKLAVKQKTKKAKPATRKIALGGLPVSLGRNNSSKATTPVMAGDGDSDPWTTGTSLATYLAALIPTHSPPFFLSYLHSPEWGSPYAAVCAALRSVRINDYGKPGGEDGGKDDDIGLPNHTSTTQDDDDDDDVQHTEMLFTLLEVLVPSPSPFDASPPAPVVTSRIKTHTLLALRATNGSGEDALELVGLLEQLHADHEIMLFENVRTGGGVYHSPAPTPTTSSARWSWSAAPSATSSTSSSTIKHITSLSLSSSSSSSPSSSSSSSKPRISSTTTSTNPWKEIPIRSKPPSTTHPPSQRHKLHPSDRRDVNGIPKSSSSSTSSSVFLHPWRNGSGTIQMGLSGLYGNGQGKDPGKENGNGRGKERARVVVEQGDYARKRDEALREASRMWQRGKRGGYGGQAAVFFAERARTFQELARKEALEGARGMVEAKRLASNTPDTIDLHGTTVPEAIDIVRTILTRTPKSSKHPNTPNPNTPNPKPPHTPNTSNKGYHGLGSAAYPLKIITGRGLHSAGGVGVLGPKVREALRRDGWVVGVWDGGLVVRGKGGAVVV